MASSTNGNGNLMDDFEEAFQACLHALTKKEANTGVTKEEVELEVQQTTNKFIDVARQMEAFFLQKRFLVSTLKPEMLLKDENQELKNEIGRKEMLINKHYASLEEWKKLLPDMQSQQSYASKQCHPQQQLQQQQEMRQQQQGMMVAAGGSSSSAMPPNMMPNPMMLQQQQQQQQHMMQSQQQHMLHAQQMHQMQHMGVGGPPMQHPMQQGVPFSNRPGPVPAGFSQNPNMLQGPLAYLEKTTSNIDMAGMGDGRR